MQNIIFETVNQDWEMNVGIGSIPYFKRVAKSARQVVRILHWTTNNEEREDIVNMHHDDLCIVLMQELDNNHLHTFYPN